MAYILDARRSPVRWRLGVALFAMLLLAASDFGLSLFGRMPFIAGIAICGIVWFVAPKRKADGLVLCFALAMLVLCAANLLINRTFNFVAFVPMFALFALAGVGDRQPAQLRLALDVVSFVAVPALISAELLTKLSLVDVPMMAELISGEATGNIYPLRAQSPFSSPLSLSSLFLGLFIAYLFFFRSLPRAAIVFALVLFTGSRLSATLMGVTLIGFVAHGAWRGRMREFWPTRAQIAGTIVPPTLAFGTILLLDVLVDEPFWEHTLGRIFGLASPDSAAEALSGRETTLASALSLLQHATEVFLVGSRQVPLHDSAFLQIAWQSGILSALLFFGLFYTLLFRTRIALSEKVWVAMIFTVSAAVVGDTVTPSAGLVYFATLLLFQTDAEVVPPR